MPTIITLRLRTIRPWKPDTRQLHGLACALFEGSRADHSAPSKPFTVHPPAPTSDGSATTLLLRASWLSEGPLPTGTSSRLLRLGNSNCQVTGNQTRTVTYDELARTPPGSRVVLNFHSPTYFSRGGERDLTPDPALILGSHRRSWNAENPPGSALHIDDESWKTLRRALLTENAQIGTTNRDSGYGHPRAGFTGTLTLRLHRDSTNETQQAFTALTRFAAYAGTGAGTTHGFGATSTRQSNTSG